MKKDDLRVVAGVALFYLVIEALGVTCPIRFLTGISCAGCGMSRAWRALLRLDLAQAAAYHPLFWLPVPAAAVLVFRERVPRWFYRGFLAIVCGLFVIVYLLRLFSPEDQIVVFRPDQGLIPRLIAGLLGTDG